MKQIRTLKPNDIEVRACDSNAKGEVHMLLYINSRSATNLLDETYGAENYNIEYVDVAGQIYCKLSIWDEEHNRYVIRMDTGEEAKISADKSLASDALKRTIVRLGVTELYSGLAIYVPDDGYKNTGYKVTEIEYDSNRNITHLVMTNRFGKEVYRWDEGSKPQTSNNTPKQAPQKKTKLSTEECVKIVNDIAQKASNCGQYDTREVERWRYGKVKWLQENNGFNGDLEKWLREKFKEKFAAA